MADSATNSSTDLTRGVKANTIADGGMILGHVGKDQRFAGWPGCHRQLHSGRHEEPWRISRDRECLEAEMELEHSTVAVRRS